MIVDFHTHVFSPEVVANREKVAQRDHWFGLLYSSPKAKMASPEELLASMREAGVDCSVMCGFPWADLGLCVAENDFLLAAALEDPAHLVAFAAVPPAAGPKAAAEAGRCLDAGMRGLGELNPDAQGFDCGDPALLRPLVGLAAERGVPILLHTNEPVGHSYPGKGQADLAGLWRLAQAFPQANLVYAHWGGGLLFYELMPEVRAALTNVFYDTAASTLLYDPAIFGLAAGIVGAERILFGSDFPLLSQRRLLRQVRAQKLPEDVLNRMLGENARRLLGLNTQEPVLREQNADG